MRRWAGVVTGVLALVLMAVGTALAGEMQAQWGAEQKATLGCDRGYCSDYIIFATGQVGFGAYMAPYDVRWLDSSQQIAVHGKIGNMGTSAADSFDPSVLSDGPVTPQEGHIYIVHTLHDDYYKVTMKVVSAGAITFTYAKATSVTAVQPVPVPTGGPGTVSQPGDNPLAPAPAPAAGSDAPSGLTAASKDGTVVLTWQASATPKAQISGYYLFRGDSAGGESSTPVTDFPAADTTYTDKGVTVGNTYYYTVQAVYPDGSYSAASPEAQVQVSAASQRKVIRLVLDSTSASVNDQQQTLDVPPQLVQSRTMVPLRFLGTALGATMTFDPATREVHYRLGANSIDLQIGSATATVNGATRVLDVPPMIVQSRTLVPLRFVSENLGASIIFNAADRSITITADSSHTATPAKPAPTSPANPAPATPANPSSWVSPNHYTQQTADGSQTLIDLTFWPEKFTGTSAPKALHVIIGQPADVTNVEIWQAGSSGAYPWRTDLTLLSQKDGEWVFNDSLTDISLPYHLRLTSASLAGAGLGSPVIDWTYHAADQGSADGTTSQTQGSSTTTASGASSGPDGAGPAGMYACGSYNISTNGTDAAGSCSTTPWLSLNPDGTYTWGSEQGTYQSGNGQVVFSSSLGNWGAGSVNSDGQIVFTFTHSGKSYRVVFYPRPH